MKNVQLSLSRNKEWRQPNIGQTSNNARIITLKLNPSRGTVLSAPHGKGNKCNFRTRQIIKYRATATLRRPPIKQYTASKLLVWYNVRNYTMIAVLLYKRRKVLHQIEKKEYWCKPHRLISKRKRISYLTDCRSKHQHFWPKHYKDICIFSLIFEYSSINCRTICFHEKEV